MGYRGKVEERARARDLRAQGWTMPDIATELGVSRSSVSVWTRDVAFTPRPRRSPDRRFGAKAPGPNALQRRKQAEIDRLLAEGAERIGALSERDFLVAGVALYAGEGNKTDGIPPTQFGKPYRAVTDGGIRRSKHVYGCATVTSSCSRTHRTVMGLVQALMTASAPTDV